VTHIRRSVLAEPRRIGHYAFVAGVPNYEPGRAARFGTRLLTAVVILGVAALAGYKIAGWPSGDVLDHVFRWWDLGLGLVLITLVVVVAWRHRRG
jgi:hypothetical protein